MTQEQRDSIQEQISIHQDIIVDLQDEICYRENEIFNLQQLLDDDSKVTDAVVIRNNNE